MLIYGRLPTGFQGGRFHWETKLCPYFNAHGSRGRLIPTSLKVLTQGGEGALYCRNSALES
jgi:hypothetical protein